MESSEGLPNPRSSSAGKESLLPTASSFSCIPPPYTSNLSHVALGSNGSIIQKPKPTDQEGIIMRNNQHQRCSSESFLLMEEQPSWLEDLLDEPESPLYKGHRRSASDSSAYLDTSVETSFNRRKESVFSNLSTGQQPWSSTQNYVNNNTLEAQRCFGGQQQSWASHESSPNSSMNFTTGLPAATRDGAVTLQTSPGSSSCGGPQEDRTGTSTITDQKLDRVASSASQRLKNVGEKGDFSQANNSASRADVKHAKQ